MMKCMLMALAFTVTLSASATKAQTYPSRPVTIIVPFAPGGAVDALGRILAAKLQEKLKQPFIIENRPGAGGNLAAESVARAAPDGATMLLTTNGHAISSSLYKALRYDPVSDFVPITQVIASALILVSNAKVPAKNLQELLALSYAKPGALNYGSTGVGNPLQLTMEMLKTVARADIQMVPFRGDAPLNQALVQGDIEMAVLPMASALPQIEAGTIRAIAVTSAKRSAVIPTVPTVAEQGFPEFDSSSWQGLFFPAKTPAVIVETIQQEVATALRDPTVAKRIGAFGAEPVGSTPQEFAALVKADIATYARIVREANIPRQD